MSMKGLAMRVFQLPRVQPPQCRLTSNPSRFSARYMATGTANTGTKRDARRIHILGAGNLGQYLARGLVKQSSKLPVTLLFHRNGLLDDWQAAGEGIECVTDGAIDRTEGIDVELLNDGEKAEPIKHLIVACKTYMAVPALKRVQRRLDENSTVVFLQNGMGTTEEVTRELFPTASARPAYWAGICVLGVSSTKPFSIIPAGRGHITLGPVVEDLISDSTESSHPTGNFLIQQMVQTEDPTSTAVTPAELRKAQLLKLVANSIINPLTVVFNCKNAELLDHASIRTLIQALVVEAGPVVRALLPPPQSADGNGDVSAFSDGKLLEYVHMVTRKTGTNTSSMLQDVRSGKKTEIDYINGFIAAQGERIGSSCLNHGVLVDMVKNGEGLDPLGIPSRFKLK